LNTLFLALLGFQMTEENFSGIGFDPLWG